MFLTSSSAVIGAFYCGERVGYHVELCFKQGTLFEQNKLVEAGGCFVGGASYFEVHEDGLMIHSSAKFKYEYIPIPNRPEHVLEFC